MNDSLFRFDGLLRLLHEGIPPASDTVRSAPVPPLSPSTLMLSVSDPVLDLASVSTATPTAAPFSPTQLADSGLWPNTFPSPAFSSPCPEKTPFRNLPQYPFLESTADSSDIRLPAPLYLCGPATSSMDVARRLIEREQLPVWGSVLAISQTTGRGQLGRSWISPQGNVYAAVRLPLCPPFSETAAAPAFGGLLAEALNGLGIQTYMKWPNDLLRKQNGIWQKVGGILLEERPCSPRTTGSARNESSLIAGIGLNLQSCPPDELLRAQRAVPAGCLADATGAACTDSPLSLWTRLVSRLFICYVEQIDGKDKGAWRALAERRLAFVGQPVIIVDGPGDRDCQHGTLEGLDLSGGLRLRNGTVSSLFLSGSLQLA